MCIRDRTETTESPAVAAATTKADAAAWAEVLDAASSGRGSWCHGSSSESVSDDLTVASSRRSAAGCSDDGHAMDDDDDDDDDQPAACCLSSVEVCSNTAQARHGAGVVVNELSLKVNCYSLEFLRAALNATRILTTIKPSVCPSLKRMHCNKTKAPIEKSSIMTNRKSTTGFPMSLR